MFDPFLFISNLLIATISTIGYSACGPGSGRPGLSCYECGKTPEDCKGKCYWSYFADMCKEKSMSLSFNPHFFYLIDFFI